jgi:hypothetical protein
MRHRLRKLAILAAIFAMVAAPAALAQSGGDEPTVDLTQFIPEQFRDQFEDRNDDGIPDFKEVPPEGVAGIWDDQVGEVEDEAFIAAVDPTGAGFDTDDEGASLTGPCKGVAISYDSEGTSVDAMFDTGGADGPRDVFGNLKGTKGNPMEVDTGGTLLYFGSSQPATFHNHQWFLKAQGIFKDNGGDPNPRDKNRNAGAVDFGSLLPFEFTAIVKAKGAWVDEYGPEELPEMASYPAPNCVGEIWVKFVGPNPLLTPPGILAMLLAAAGFTGVLFNARPALSWREG